MDADNFLELLDLYMDMVEKQDEIIFRLGKIVARQATDIKLLQNDHEFSDKKLEEDMQDVLNVVVMGRACRNDGGLKNRQPVGRMYIKADFTLEDFYRDIIRDELNVKEVVFTDDVRDFTSYTFKPQLRTVGPRYGKLLGGIQKALAALDGNEAMDRLNAEGHLVFEVNGQNVELTREDLLIDAAQKDGYVSQENNTLTVVLDTNLTQALIEEGFVY